MFYQWIAWTAGLDTWHEGYCYFIFAAMPEELQAAATTLIYRRRPL